MSECARAACDARAQTIYACTDMLSKHQKTANMLFLGSFLCSERLSFSLITSYIVFFDSAAIIDRDTRDTHRWSLPPVFFCLAHNLSVSGSALGIYRKAMGGRGAVGEQAGGRRELG